MFFFGDWDASTLRDWTRMAKAFLFFEDSKIAFDYLVLQGKSFGYNAFQNLCASGHHTTSKLVLLKSLRL